MMRRPIILSVWTVSVALIGCSSRPSLDPPKFNPKAIAARAMELFDSDSDGLLNSEELNACPGLKGGLRTVDKDGDSSISSEEIVTRMDALVAARNAAQIVECQITQGGKPVTEAEVSFDPEPFFDGAIVAATGTTDLAGKAEMTCSALPIGIQPGFYRVSISKVVNGKETIPQQFNQSTTLGTEVSGLSVGDEIGCYFFRLD